MTKRELRDYRAALAERDTAEREYLRMLRRREEIAGRDVLNEDRRSRFLLRLDREIAEGHERMVRAQLALEGYGDA
ncbi:MAG: hypothetical protein IJV64_07715 [Oscillospiraceae bacterium]|nr:hypothetical protein [Oscillospiraceae bacterium]